MRGRGLPWWTAPVVGSVLALVALFAGAKPADATWSIVAVDPETGLVGAALASCVPAGVLGDADQALVPVVLVPGTAAATVQGTIDPEAPGRLRRFLEEGASADEAVLFITGDDESPGIRQYAVATVDDAEPAPIATFTGTEVEREADADGRSGPDRVAAIGVLLVDTAVIERATTAFVAARQAGRSLDRALADALVAGSEAGGDRRCGDQTALFAHVAVAEPDDDPLRPSLLLTVTVDEGDGQNPVLLLDRALDEGRTGWIDAGLVDPAGLPRTAVMIVGVLLAVAAALVLRLGLGSPPGRRAGL